MSRTALLIASVLYVFAAIGDGVTALMRIVFVCYALANVCLALQV